jgi:hypothetical protein
MRCYFMRNGHIASVEVLEGVTDDAAAIKLGSTSFLKRLRDGFEGFEIWERDRMVFRYPEDENQAGPDGKSAGQSSPKGGGKGSSQAGPAFYAGIVENIARAAFA